MCFSLKFTFSFQTAVYKNKLKQVPSEVKEKTNHNPNNMVEFILDGRILFSEMNYKEQTFCFHSIILYNYQEC